MDHPPRPGRTTRPQLKALRKQRGLTQSQLGALLGVSQARVVEIEAKPGAVSLQQILQVLQVLGASLVVRAGTLSYSAESPATPLRVGRSGVSGEPGHLDEWRARGQLARGARPAPPDL